jgi:hypothetical protein
MKHPSLKLIISKFAQNLSTNFCAKFDDVPWGSNMNQSVGGSDRKYMARGGFTPLSPTTLIRGDIKLDWLRHMVNLAEQ